MSYANGLIIFGVTTPNWRGRRDKEGNVGLAEALDAHAATFPTREEGWDAIERLGFEGLYEAPSDKWFGVKLGEMDETEDYDLENLPRVTPDAVAKFNEKVAALPKEVRAAMPAPKWQIVWYSS